MKSPRDPIEVAGDILQLAKVPVGRVYIMREARLSYSGLEKYLNLLVKKRFLKVLLQDDRRLYEITPEGLQYMKEIAELLKLLR